MTNITITKSDISDLKEILELQYAAYQSEAKLLNNFEIPPLKQTYDEITKEYVQTIFLKATDETGKIIGSVRAHTENDTAFIGRLIVQPDKQGQGIGTKLLLMIEQYYSASYSVGRYELFTSEKSTKNIRLYECLGYRKFREQKVSDDLNLVYLEKEKK